MKLSWKKVSIFLVFSLLCYILKEAFIANGVVKIDQVYINNIALENVNYIIQIVVGIFVIIGTLIAVWQYVLSTKDSMKNREREYQLHEKEIFEMEKDRVQKAIELSAYYKDHIITDISTVMSIYAKTEIKDILDKIDFSSITHFDRYEMEKVISISDIKKIKEVGQNPKMIEVLVQTNEITRLWEDCKEVKIEEKDGKTIKSIVVSSGVMMYKFHSLLRDLLNNLEYFAMNFTHNTADESVVYQSLHKIYGETVRCLYYDISANNEPGEAKLYTNIIELYNLWEDKAKKQKEEETAAARVNISKGKTLKAIDK